MVRHGPAAAAAKAHGYHSLAAPAGGSLVQAARTSRPGPRAKGSAGWPGPRSRSFRAGDEQGAAGVVSSRAFSPSISRGLAASLAAARRRSAARSAGSARRGKRPPSRSGGRGRRRWPIRRRGSENRDHVPAGRPACARGPAQGVIPRRTGRPHQARWRRGGWRSRKLAQGDGQAGEHDGGRSPGAAGKGGRPSALRGHAFRFLRVERRPASSERPRRHWRCLAGPVAVEARSLDRTRRSRSVRWVLLCRLRAGCG